MKFHIKKGQKGLIICILVLAVFNDVFRLPGTVMSGYRIFLPVATLLIIYVLYNKIIKYILVGMLLCLFLPFQNLIFLSSYDTYMKIDIRRTIQFVLLYVSIFIIFLLVKVLRIKYKDSFIYFFQSTIPFLGVLCTACYLVCLTPLYRILNSFVSFANRNNYAVCLCSIFPWYFLKMIRKGFNLKSAIIVFSMVVFLYIGDSKAALAGIVLEIGIILAMRFMGKVRHSNKIAGFFLATVIAGGVSIARSPIKINGYQINLMFNEMISHITTMTVFTDGYSSLTYRTNAIIYMIDGIRRSKFMGIGLGNTGILLVRYMPDMLLQTGGTILSGHYGLLEFFCDCGIWAILLFGYAFYNGIRIFLNAKNAGDIDIAYASFIISFPMWSMSASGLYTIYYMFIVMACFYEWHLMKKESKRGGKGYVCSE